jgi:hypothetical protein
MKCVLTALAIALVAGCTSKTETGYIPRKLGDNLTVQKGYYAAPYSPEAQAAQQERTIELQHSRPDLRY